MSSPTLNQGIFPVETVTQTLPETQPDKSAERGADAALTARAIVAVTLLGAGAWYLLWKTVLYFLAGH
jgi:hypothetical protein